MTGTTLLVLIVVFLLLVALIAVIGYAVITSRSILEPGDAGLEAEPIE